MPKSTQMSQSKWHLKKKPPIKDSVKNFIILKGYNVRVDPKLKWSMTIYLGIEKVLAL